MLEPKNRTNKKKGPKSEKRETPLNKVCNCKMCCYFGTGDDTWFNTYTQLRVQFCGYFWFAWIVYLWMCMRFCALHTIFISFVFVYSPTTAANLLFNICFAHFYYRIFQLFFSHSHTDKNASHICNNTICIFIQPMLLRLLFTGCCCCCFNYWLFAEFSGFLFLKRKQIGCSIGFIEECKARENKKYIRIFVFGALAENKSRCQSVELLKYFLSALFVTFFKFSNNFTSMHSEWDRSIEHCFFWTFIFHYVFSLLLLI